MKEKIDSFIDSQKENFIRELKTLIDIKSVREAPLPGKPFGEGCARVLSQAMKLSAVHGFNMVNIDNYAGEITFGENPSVMLLAHLDVVPEGDFWTKEPYNMSVEGGRLYGRGTTDDKGPALACLYALTALRELFGAPAAGVRLVMGCGEETGSEDMDYYFSKREKLPYTLSPDADYPLINIEKGRYAPVFYMRPENSGEKIIVSFSGGTTPNIVPCRASAVVRGISEDIISSLIPSVSEKTGVSFSLTSKSADIEISALGVSAHAAMPESGRNAQTALIYLLTLLPLDRNGLFSAFKTLSSLLPYGETDGSSIGVKMSDDVSGSLTLNFGVLSYSDGLLKGNMDLRCPLCSTEENVKSVIVEKLSSAGFLFDSDLRMTPVHYVPEDAPLIKTALGVYEEYTGEKGRCLAIGGGTYVHGIEGGIAFGIEFPDTDYHIHGADEFAVTDELLLTAKMYASVIYKLCY